MFKLVPQSLASFILMVIVFSPARRALGQASNPVVLSRDATGPIMPGFLALTLQSNTACDQSESVIPDGSSMLSAGFQFSIDDRGVGTFFGVVQFVSPNGTLLNIGLLHGVAGLTSHRDPGADCLAPGHLEGVIDALPNVFPMTPVTASMISGRHHGSGAPFRGGGWPPLGAALWELSFSADPIPELAGPIAVYRARVDGLITLFPTVPPNGDVAIAPDRAAYLPSDQITANITNGLARDVEIFDSQSFCTIVTLDRLDGNQWDAVSPCLIEIVSLPTLIKAGETLEITLPPDPSAAADYLPGVYHLRVEFLLLDAAGNPTGDPSTAVSDSFSVVPPPQPLEGTVTLTTDKISYPTDGQIVATIDNETKRMIAVADHRSFCTTLVLQARTGGAWKNIASCPLMSPTQLITIDAKQSLLVAMPPGPGLSILDPGTYRVELDYLLEDSSGMPSGPPMTITSMPFSIGP